MRLCFFLCLLGFFASGALAHAADSVHPLEQRDLIISPLLTAPQPVAGGYVNTPGYEDSPIISPDGEYLYVLTGPWNFSAAIFVAQICQSSEYKIGYDLNNCQQQKAAALIREVVGPSGPPLRPDFPQQSLQNGQLRLAPGVVIPGVANGITPWPTVYYGFKRQSDSSFAEPFKLAFDDARAFNSPFGLSLTQSVNGLTTFMLAWNNYKNELGDDKPDLYVGQMPLGQPHSLGTVTYGSAFAGDEITAITANLVPLPLPSHKGQQGNPHFFVGYTGWPTLVWHDDEDRALDISLYAYQPTGQGSPWVPYTLPDLINTGEHERQPFFDSQHLYLMRRHDIVRHKFICKPADTPAAFAKASCWGREEILLGVSKVSAEPGSVIAFGEPSIAYHKGKKLLYFAFVYNRLQQRFLPEVNEANADIGWAELRE